MLKVKIQDMILEIATESQALDKKLESLWKKYKWWEDWEEVMPK